MVSPGRTTRGDSVDIVADAVLWCVSCFCDVVVVRFRNSRLVLRKAVKR